MYKNAAKILQKLLYKCGKNVAAKHSIVQKNTQII